MIEGLLPLEGWPLTVLLALLAVGLDLLLGEPRRFHPLVGFGALANRAERWLHGGVEASPGVQRLRGALALLIICLPLVLLVALPDQNSGWGALVSVLVLYAAIGHRSLREHVLPIADALEAGDDVLARQRAAMIVSRDPDTMDVPRSTVESALENGSDGIFAALFWFLLAGAPGVLIYRLINTLDAMWGYRSDRYLHFGWAAARLDDLLNWLPARLVASSYALLGNTHAGLRCWRQQASLCSSPNGGPVMCAGAGALGVRLGGPTRYRGTWLQKPELGCGASPQPADIRRAMGLVTDTLWFWLLLLSISALVVTLLEVGYA